MRRHKNYFSQVPDKICLADSRNASAGELSSKRKFEMWLRFKNNDLIFIPVAIIHSHRIAYGNQFRDVVTGFMQPESHWMLYTLLFINNSGHYSVKSLLWYPLLMPKIIRRLAAQQFWSYVILMEENRKKERRNMNFVNCHRESCTFTF